jgi:hypothetical protein
MVAVIHVDDEAVSRLEQLGLEVESIERALLRGDAEARTISQLAPKGFEGTVRWGRASEFLREDLCGQGWTPDDTQNIARSISPEGSDCIVVTTGAKGTGVQGADPTTKYTKGSGTVACVEANYLLDFAPEDLRKMGLIGRPAADMRTWFLLFLVAGDTIYAELSLPDVISKDGQITSWRERILLPPINLGPSTFPDDETGPTDPIDIPVSRR